MLKHTTSGKLASLLGVFVLCLSGAGLTGPTSLAKADEISSDSVSPVGVDGQGNPLEFTPELAAAASQESSAAGGVVEAYSPEDRGGWKIIGPDGRQRITNTTDFPNRAIVYIHQSDGTQHCTGWLVSADTLVTAGHCIYGKNGWNFDLEYSPGANEAERPYGTAKAARMWTDTSWISNRESKLDWAIVKLSQSFPQVGHFGYRWQNASLDGTKVDIRGYPGDKPHGEMWGMAGTITRSEANNLYYQIDTAPGQSGSPVFLGDVNQSVAIHRGGDKEKNQSTRITESLFNVISELRR